MNRVVQTQYKLIMLKSMWQVINHPEDTPTIFKISVYQNKLATEEDKANLTKIAYEASPNLGNLYSEKFVPEKYDIEKLLQLPEGTLGHEYAKQMKANGLDPDFYDHFAIDNKWDYLRQRVRQTHDIWHTLTGYSTHYIGELGLQAFYMAQFKNFLSLAIIICFWFHSLINRKYSDMAKSMEIFYEAYGSGKKAKNILGEKWEDLWDRDLEEVRKLYNIQPTAIKI